jgi:hypothetical protein
MSVDDTVILYRPVGPEELALIRESGFRRFPPRLPHQPIFYPVLTEAYATKIARDWNVKASGAGYVTRFAYCDLSWTAIRFRPPVARSIANIGFRRQS